MSSFITIHSSNYNAITILTITSTRTSTVIGTRRSTQSCEMSNLFHRENTEINLHPLWSHVWTNISARFVTFCNIAMHCTGSEKQSQLGCGKITKTHLVPLVLPPFQLLEPNCAVLLVAGGKVKQLVETARLRSGWKYKH